jgi:hypothetical protein
MVYFDLTTVLAVAAVVLVTAWFSVWYLEQPHRKKELFLDPKYIWFCTVCTYTYINTKDEVISNCPRCAGYNKKS